jgi:hypothetical protein
MIFGMQKSYPHTQQTSQEYCSSQELQYQTLSEEVEKLVQ